MIQAVRDLATVARDLVRAVRRRRELRRRVPRSQIAPVRLLPSPDPTDIICLTRCRDECLRLPAFLAHHRSLGIGRFVIIDNGSRDGSVDVLLGEPDVDVFETKAPLSQASAGIVWLQYLFDRYGSHRCGISCSTSTSCSCIREWISTISTMSRTGSRNVGSWL